MRLAIGRLVALAFFFELCFDAAAAPKSEVPIISLPSTFSKYDKNYRYDQDIILKHMERLLAESKHRITISNTGWGSVSTLDSSVATPLALCIITTEFYGHADAKMEKTFSRILGFLGYMLVPETIMSPDRQADPYSGFGKPKQSGELYDAPGMRQTFEQFLREAAGRMNARSSGYRMNIYRGLK